MLLVPVLTVNPATTNREAIMTKYVCVCVKDALVSCSVGDYAVGHVDKGNEGYTKDIHEATIYDVSDEKDLQEVLLLEEVGFMRVEADVQKWAQGVMAHRANTRDNIGATFEPDCSDVDTKLNYIQYAARVNTLTDMKSKIAAMQQNLDDLQEKWGIKLSD